MLLAQLRDGSVLLERRAGTRRLGRTVVPAAVRERRRARACSRPRASLTPRSNPNRARIVRHAFTHFELEISPLLARCAGSSGVMDGPPMTWYNRGGARAPGPAGAGRGH